jgi:DNA polymerase
MPEELDRCHLHRYLQAMQVEVWLPRGGAGAGEHETAGAGALAGSTAAPALEAAASPGGEVARMSLAALEAKVAECRLCPLAAGRTRAVFGVGDANARCMIIGEAPGAEEDRRGEPFVGRAGQLLNAMLWAMGLSRDSVYIANIVKCRPPKNRDPKPEEMVACGTYLRRQIALVKPRVILAVGRVAAQHLVGSTIPIGRMRGQSYFYDNADDGARIPLVVTYHPAYLLRSPLEKRKSWEDLKRACRLLESSR